MLQRSLCFSLFWLLILTAGGVSHADEAAVVPPLMSSTISRPALPEGSWSRNQITVSTLAEDALRPRIDGVLDEPCWQAATHASGFYRFTGSAPVLQQTEAWICCDKKNLYIAFHCLDSEPQKIRAAETQRGGNLDHDDYVAIDIDSQNSRRNLSWFLVSARGTQAEHIEGGTADNITWSGDWQAATRRTGDGWTAEIAIPFPLLRYPKGTKSFGMLLYRQLARETSLECWPYFPTGRERDEPQYLNDFTGIHPPAFAPRPVFLPYLLSRAGESAGGSSGDTAGGTQTRFGLDVKYPITTTLIGVAAFNPDFLTVEQQVTDINFSYTEKFLPDRRPFFAEGGDFLPSSDVFYSRRIGQIEGGLKVVGKEGDTTVGLLGVRRPAARNWLGTADDAERAGRSDTVLNVRRDLGTLSAVTLNLVRDQRQGLPFNQVARVEGNYGVRAGRFQRLDFAFSHTPSWVENRQKGSKEYARAAWQPANGHVRASAEYISIAPDFTANLGFNPDRDFRGGSLHLEQHNHFDRGQVEEYEVGSDSGSFQRQTGGFFKRDLSGYVYLGLRSGWSGVFSHGESGREQFRDHSTDYELNWNQKTLFSGGGLHYSSGQQQDQRFQFIQLDQGVLLLPAFSVSVRASRLKQGPMTVSQQVITGSFRLNGSQTLGGRLVRQEGYDPSSVDPLPHGTNLYLSYGRHARSGNDLFILIGDPNSDISRGLVTIKVLHPL